MQKSKVLILNSLLSISSQARKWYLTLILTTYLGRNTKSKVATVLVFKAEFKDFGAAYMWNFDAIHLYPEIQFQQKL